MKKRQTFLCWLIPGLSVLPSIEAKAQTVTALYSFTGTNTGGRVAGLIQGRDGAFYGTIEASGSKNLGMVFKIIPNGTLTTLFSFSGDAHGYDPLGGLVQASDGDFFGSTGYGGPNNSGTMFKITTKGALTTFLPFNGGQFVEDPLIQGRDGRLYGEAQTGAVEGGVLFKMTTNGVLTTFHTFTGGDGGSPTGGLVQGTDGYFYGTTYAGGLHNDGTVFQISANGVLTTLHSFNISDGASPQTALVQGKDGSLYGTTAEGGPTYGTVFKITTNGLLTTLHSFTGDDGSQPLGALVQGIDGDFYGTTSIGGSLNAGEGTVFKISGNGTLTTLYNFGGGDDGGFPVGALIQGLDGALYGTTSDYGMSGVGTVFSVVLPSPPALQITRGANNVTLRWPTNVIAYPFKLQSTTNLTSGGGWSNVSPSVVVINGQNTATNLIFGAQKFYRLSQ
jgi:uncharacterized repeat protein (TIGR03803 family)